MNYTVEELLTLFKGKEKYLHYYLAGFVDGEGSFSVAIIKHPTEKFGWMINPCFQVYQHEKHREILELYKFVFKTGTIYRKSGIHPVLNFSINSRRNILERVIPFFDRYPLITKQDAYQKFRTIVKAMERGTHRTRAGYIELITLAYTMNQQGKGRKHPLEYIVNSVINSSNSVVESSETIRQTSLENNDDDIVHAT